VYFTDQSTGNITSWNWTFGDGETSTDQNPSHQYTTAGSYNVTLNVTTACSSDTETKTNYITVYAGPTADAGNDTSISCNGGATIGGSPTGSGGTPPYSYSWTPTGGLNDASIANPTASAGGNYTVQVMDDNGCWAEDTVVVTVAGAPTADAGPDQEICPGGSPVIGGSPTASGGASPYSYSWTPATGLNATDIANPTASPSSDTIYSVSVTDSGGCQAVDHVHVTVDAPTAAAGADAVIISGESVVIGGTPTASDGTPPYSYSWSPITGLNDTSIASPTASPIVNTTYNVTVTDSNGCTDSDDVTVTVIQNCCICGFVYRAGTTQGLAGWQVILDEETANQWVQAGIAVTDANGKYCFCGLGSGHYRVREVVQPSWNQVSPLPNEYLVTLPGSCADAQAGPFLNFENQQGPAGSTVGWRVLSIDKLAVLAPWIALFAAIFTGTSFLVLRRRRA
jgi:hypothetical protein